MLRVRAAFHLGGTGSHPGQTMYDLEWVKWLWDKFFSEFFGFSSVNKRQDCPWYSKKYHAFKNCGGLAEVFLDLVTRWMWISASRPVHIIPRERSIISYKPERAKIQRQT